MCFVFYHREIQEKKMQRKEDTGTERIALSILKICVVPGLVCHGQLAARAENHSLADKPNVVREIFPPQARD